MTATFDVALPRRIELRSEVPQTPILSVKLQEQTPILPASLNQSEARQVR